MNKIQEACARVCDAEADSMEQGAQRAIESGEHEEVSAIRSTAWRLQVAANRIRALKFEEVSAEPVGCPLLYTAQTTAEYLAKKFYPHVSQWKVLDDLPGVLSQIDNMVTGIPQPAAEPVAWRHRNLKYPGSCINDVHPSYYGSDWEHDPLTIPQPCPRCAEWAVYNETRTDELLAATQRIAALEAEVKRLKGCCSKMNDEIMQTLGKALGYPWYKDDQKNFPGATEVDGICPGDNVSECMAMEAATKITTLGAEINENQEYMKDQQSIISTQKDTIEEQADKIEKLEDDNALLWGVANEDQAEINQLREKLAAAEKDAERYRWLREPRILRRKDFRMIQETICCGNYFDSAIDAAIAEVKP